MTDRPGTAGGSTGTDDSAGRGRLDISAKAIERIATHAARNVSGVTVSGSGLDKMVGRHLPRASSTVAGDTVRLNIDISLTWPVAAGDVARRVRAEVTRHVGQLTGLSVAAVDVSVERFEPLARSAARRIE